MRLSRLVYRLLAAIIYPVFRAKLTDIQGLEYLPSRDGYIIAANHVDWLDGFYITAAVESNKHRPVNFLTKSNNYWWTTIAVQIPSDQKGAIMDYALAKLKTGAIVCNFPEGRRNAEQMLLPGKTGTVRMAIDAGVPIIPTGIICASGCTMIESIKFLFDKKRAFTLRFGPPMKFDRPTGEITKDWLESQTAGLMAAIAPLAEKRV